MGLRYSTFLDPNEDLESPFLPTSPNFSAYRACAPYALSSVIGVPSAATAVPRMSQNSRHDDDMMVDDNKELIEEENATNEEEEEEEDGDYLPEIDSGLEEVDDEEEEEEEEEDDDDDDDDDEDDDDDDDDDDEEEEENDEESSLIAPYRYRSYYTSPAISNSTILVQPFYKKHSQYNRNGKAITYGCKDCLTHLSSTNLIIDDNYRGKTGDALLIHKVVNIICEKPEERIMTTGKYTVCDIKCHQCYRLLGWKYLASSRTDQKYKVGKYILEVSNIIEAR